MSRYIPSWMQNCIDYYESIFKYFSSGYASFGDWFGLVLRVIVIIGLSILIVIFHEKLFIPWAREMMHRYRWAHRKITIGIIIVLLILNLFLFISCYMLTMDCYAMEKTIEHLNNFNKLLIDELNG